MSWWECDDINLVMQRCSWRRCHLSSVRRGLETTGDCVDSVCEKRVVDIEVCVTVIATSRGSGSFLLLLLLFHSISLRPFLLLPVMHHGLDSSVLQDHLNLAQFIKHVLLQSLEVWWQRSSSSSELVSLRKMVLLSSSFREAVAVSLVRCRGRSSCSCAGAAEEVCVDFVVLAGCAGNVRLFGRISHVYDTSRLHMRGVFRNDKIDSVVAPFTSSLGTKVTLFGLGFLNCT
ncbi:uncharacterized protein YALI1_B04703g [Yarrowia lipolytica]|uniref:Uncharacterized protein n=1 Tax=Yarrowia lipolytica TaxID=4952 RepID=A0A1D8N696_YARLL|nr:hypothetical protein YALI1_B04703g [Yarrowia lipolytica]